jgi:hypothetical protein
VKVDFPPKLETFMKISIYSWKQGIAAILALFIASLASLALADEGQDKVKALITATPYTMKAMKDGADISERWPVKAIRYMTDGTATSTLADGREIKSTWTLDAQAQQLTINTPGVGESRWAILEVTPKVFRKRNVDNGVEAIQTPR